MPPETARFARTIDPHHFGPLDDQSRPRPEPGELFSGAERFLGRREGKRRTVLWYTIGPRIETLCAEDEQVLYVARAVQKVGILHYMALGALVLRYHQVALVFTTKRVLEVLLGFDGKTLAERTRSFAWNEVAAAKIRLSRVVLEPTRGKRETWQLPVRGDRKLLKILLPRITESSPARPDAPPTCWAALHCPRCGIALPPEQTSCEPCRTRFRSPGLAAGLSLAFPGAGLFYAGHPVLAAFDLLGEAMIYAMFAFLLLVAGSPAEIGTALAFGAILIGLTKLESMHIGHVLLSRRPLESPERPLRFRRAAYAGAALSAVALLAPLLVAGKLAAVVDHDLEFAADGTKWAGSRSAEDYELFVDDPDLRSQWFHVDGWITSVFAYPLGVGETLDVFHDAFLARESSHGATVLLDDSDLPGGFVGFRLVERVETENDPVGVVHYIVHDPLGNDVHQLLMAVQLADVELADAAMRDLLARGRWIDPPALEP